MFSKAKFINSYFKYISIISIILVLIYSSLFSITKNNSVTEKPEFPPDVKDTIYVYDTIVQFDTVYIYETVYDTVYIYDTINYDEISGDTLKSEIPDTILSDTTSKRNFHINIEFKLPELQHKIKFYAGGGIGISSFSKIITWSQLANDEFIDLYKKTSKYPAAANLGFNILANYQNFELQTGLNYMQYFEKFDFFHQKLNVDTSIFFSYFQNNHYKVDTIFYLDLDELLNGDTVWLSMFDTTFTYFKDSTLVTEFDSVLNNVEKKSLNLYSYIEIPLIFGYQFNKRRYSISPMLGFVIGINCYKKGYSFGYNEDYFIKKIIINNYPRINLSLYGSVNLRYKINRNLFMYAEPAFSFNLNKAFSNQYNKVRYLGYGIKFGFYYLL